MKTFIPKTKDTKRSWYEADASQFTLGRLASKVASILRGKHKVTFTPHMDLGDFVVVKNAEKVRFTGRKLAQKKYHRFSGYPGGLYTKTLAKRMETEPEKVIRDAVYNMIDKNRLRKHILRRLKVVTGEKHEFHVEKQIN
ncbi:MAG: 50S ribosomal protein L13 [Candidatus Doudnabacteria bacterium RIFCSPLOWO2_02_FULL_49_13]|uniref:Large ribosomal subunit protein uL13 n=1 Tax=Candidatus Doudnabacteria bacterium RIFCSPHIGHO2_12_FULL_48_16 TaxID=1817838 RepID=A0A1F5PIN3_9BACT|nr:MAG: 50S ribosomal protein L13 [Candidatus Doudnabacteria bacterium RIFCSPHIGHO2_02_FULL_49_24]OGE89535.1 MAG: 50S ribosomal protein L13 [Candidatus Doudnabacteria bacterium RIFCSPHIGHO2_01_FULL_50_67]OGE89786.1 MAG: 50S ribosomal protein L13 [Candidatus Doudnabacteria bacterium RIFCSPHIGHO2_12_FULL_48_16]OGE97690.1 MAG: 50S ribosomal protein L13 [Candidatus Doudnabacteria bacterium RIFCSPLOWO2_01_FULL_49_40]OGF02789.1 MAG: 50S ribosomal protein L13 [Candidatus Doudnabacteria bacterium RIFCS